MLPGSAPARAAFVDTATKELAALRDQIEVFGPVASTPTAWRLLADTDEAALASL